MSINIWGPSTWILFHTLIEKLTDDGFDKIGLPLFTYIKRICRNLPCPDCAQHASYFLSQINLANIKTKHDLKTTIYIFHNNVNKRKNKPIYNMIDFKKWLMHNINFFI